MPDRKHSRRVLEVEGIVNLTIPHLPLLPHAIRISILDGSSEVDHEEKLLSSMTRHVEVHTRKLDVSSVWHVALEDAETTSRDSDCCLNNSHAHGEVKKKSSAENREHVK